MVSKQGVRLCRGTWYDVCGTEEEGGFCLSLQWAMSMWRFVKALLLCGSLLSYHKPGMCLTPEVCSPGSDRKLNFLDQFNALEKLIYMTLQSTFYFSILGLMEDEHQ